MRSTEGKPESPTTAQPLDFDDDDHTTAQTPTKMSATDDASKPNPPPKDEAPPAKPPRPVNPAEQTLQEAFPGIDQGVVKAVLIASGGQLEPAFNALLAMSDPDAAQQEQPPAKPPRPTSRQQTNQTLLEADEMYARQLAEHYNNTTPQQTQQRPDRSNANLAGSRPGRPGAQPNPDDVHWRSFIDGANEFAEEVRGSANEILTDDLPEIRDNLKKGFFETQKTVSSWITNFKKNFDDGGDQLAGHTAQNARPAQQQQRRSGDYGRRSTDYNRYDADPQVIDDDFSKLDLKDGEHPPRTSSRPVANPNLFKSDHRASSKGSGRKVSFQEGPPEEITDMYAASSSKPQVTSVQTAGTTAGKSSKWQPLSAVESSPSGENDPFSLGDSDDERDAKPITLKDTEADDLNIGAEASVRESGSKKATVEDTN